MTVEEHLDCIAALRAGQLVVELHGSDLGLLTATQRAQYVGEIAMHIRDYLLVELETAEGVIRAEQRELSEWADRQEFERIVNANFPKGSNA